MIIKDGKITLEVEVSPYEALLEVLPTTPDCATFKGYWRVGDTILCDTEERANALADLFDSCGYESTTGYYDPEEDKRSGEVDRMTGYWCVDV